MRATRAEQRFSNDLVERARTTTQTSKSTWLTGSSVQRKRSAVELVELLRCALSGCYLEASRDGAGALVGEQTARGRSEARGRTLLKFDPEEAQCCETCEWPRVRLSQPGARHVLPRAEL